MAQAGRVEGPTETRKVSLLGHLLPHGDTPRPIVARNRSSNLRNRRGGIGRHATLRTSCPCGVRVRLSPSSLYCRPGRCLTGRHEAGVPGSIPGSATCGWASAQRSLMSFACRVRLPDPLLTDGRVRKQAKRRGREPRDFVGSTPTLVTDMIPWSNGEDACVTCRRVMVRFHPGSLTRRSVGVPVAHVRGKDGDRVRFPDGPLTKRAGMYQGRRLILARSV